MSIKHYLSAAAALAMFAACSDYDPGMSNQAVDLTDVEIETIKEYTENFVERYGEIDPNHTWGFDELAGEEMETRTVNTNRNNWYLKYQDGSSGVQVTSWKINPYEFSDEDVIIPGFPSKVDNKYYIEKPQGQVTIYDDKEAMLAENSSVSPIGDVTDEEIQYVSEWFRTNQYPDSDVPEFTEFFIQDISQDYDRVSYPNGAAIDLNLQVYNGGQPDPDNPGFYKGGTVDGGKDPLVYGMDYFAVKTSEADWEHESNFNAQKTNKINGTVPDNSTTFPNRTLKYWTTNGGYTTSFLYHNSDQSQKYENYVLVHLSFDGPRTGLHYDGYYLAFDYQYVKQHNTSTDPETGETTYKYSQRKPDGYYSNWIVKLSPADPEFYEDPDPNTRTVTVKRRVMCEDLGSTFDFDFNDLVFDVTYTQNQKKVGDNWEPVNADKTWTATITLQAAGGTLPIYIKNFNGAQYNVHEMLGSTLSNGSYSPVNVGTGSTHVPVTLPSGQVSSDDTNPDKIAIFVTSPDKENRGASKVLELPSSEGDQNFGTNLAPQKICVPVTTRWTKEYQQIEWAYPYFHEWVNRQHGDFDFENPNDWTKKDVDTQYLFNK